MELKDNNEVIINDNSKLKKNEKRVIYYDILNIIAIFSVIALHCSGTAVYGNIHTRAWKTGLIVECLFYFAVPLFLMLSGATLMTYREKYDTKTFFKKRFIKVFIPFIFWAVFMFVWGAKENQINTSQYKNLVDWINAFFSNQELTIYYFMFEILGVYLTMPLLSLLAKKENRKSLWGVVLLYFIFNSLLPNILGVFKIYWNKAFSVKIGDYIIFIILGYLLANEDLSKKKTFLLFLGSIEGLIYRYITTYFLSMSANTLVKITWGYSSWHSILLACTVFTLVKKMNFDELFGENKTLIRVLNKISGCSFGVYLIHIVIMYYEVQIFNINKLSVLWRTIWVPITYVISLSMVYLLKKIPIVKKVLP